MLSMQQSVAALLGIAIIFAIKNSAVGYKGWCLKSQSQFPRRSFALRMGTQKSNEQKSIYSEFLERFGLSQEKADQRGHTTKNTQQSELKVKKEERTPLDEIRRGSRCSGRIVSIRSNGMFVDIGASRDGFLHIKDCSDKYFIDNLHDRYQVGQQVDVYVKFVDSKLNSLALQLYPVAVVDANIKLDWNDIKTGSQYRGVVVKSSSFGVYVDFGGPVLGFLHRQKMLSNRRQRKLKPWDLCPIGSSQDCFVYRVRQDRHQVELTTYPPDRWEGIFDLYGTDSPWESPSQSHNQRLGEERSSLKKGNPVSSTESSTGDDFILDDTAKDDYEESDDDYDDDEGGYTESEEILSPSEIQKLTKYDVLIDDFQGSPHANGGHGNDEDDDPLEEGRVDIDEMFKEISEGRPFITLRDIREWDIIKTTIDEGILTRDALRSIFVRSGAVRGKLVQSRFENFVKLFDKEMEAIEQTDEISPLAIDSVHPISAEATAAIVNGDEDVDEDNVDNDSVDHIDIVTNIFTNLAGAKDVLTFDDVLRWDECQRLINEGAATATMIADLFRDACARNDNRMGIREFMDFQEDIKDLSNIESLFTVEDQLAAMERLEKTMAISKFEAINHDRPSLDDGEQPNHWEEEADNAELLEFLDRACEDDEWVRLDGERRLSETNQVTTDEESDEALLQEVFADVSNGKSFVAVKDLLNWDFVIDMLAEGIITEWELEEKVKKYSERKGMSIQGFDRLLDDLMYLYDNHIALHESRDTTDDESLLDPESNESPVPDEFIEEDEGDVSSDLTNEEDEEAMILDPTELFSSLSKDGKFVSFEAIRRWEFVQSMEKSGQLSRIQLEHLLSNIETKMPNKLSAEEFESFLDEVILLCGGEIEDTYADDLEVINPTDES